jgi:putative Mg2+ transporter-C (MgtC) family protein
MSPHVGWPALLLRLVLTLVAGGLIGFDRSEHGKPAGLRTTMLVGLAAAIAMMQTNLLLPTAGKEADSFAQFDVMRLPLGILTGVGFIGGGAILRRGDLVLGVTTAATLWFVTVVGLCFGGGQLALGAVATALGLAVLWVLAYAERYMRLEHRATLVLAAAGDAAIEPELVGRLRAGGYRVSSHKVAFAEHGNCRESQFDLRWQGTPDETAPPAFLVDVAHLAGVVSLRWDPVSL